MSSAFYPQGMRSYNNSVNTGGYKTWKGRGVFSNPVGMASGNMRPLTNLDPANDAIYKVGSQRPIRHYRIGRAIKAPILREDPENPGEFIETYYYADREVKSSTPGRLIGQLIDRPGNFIVKPNNPDTFNLETGILEETEKIPAECRTCNGIAIVSNWMPINDLTDKPEAITQTKLFCCNAEKKALKRVLPANTVLKKNYYTTTKQYLYNRCQTFKQRQFNFLTGIDNPDLLINKESGESKYVFDAADLIAAEAAKPGSPLSIFNLYVANCNPNVSPDLEEYGTRKCKRVYYKPNNPQFAQQGAVSSSTRTFKANVTTIEKNISNYRRAVNGATNLSATNPVAAAAAVPFIYKLKTEKCNPAYFTKNGNPKTCFRGANDATISGVDFANASI